MSDNRKKSHISRSEKARRLSTPRRVPIEKTKVEMSDGFTFTSKRKHVEIPTVEKTNVRTSKRIKAVKEAKAQDIPPKPVTTTTRMGKKVVKIPEYPSVEHTKLITLKEKDKKSQAALAQKVFNTLMSKEMEVVSKTYTDDFLFAAKAVSSVCKSMSHELESFDSKKDIPIVTTTSSKTNNNIHIQKNPENLELESALRVWNNWLKSANTDISSLNELKEKWINMDVESTFDSSIYSNDKKLNSSDEAFLSASVAGNLLSSIPEAFNMISIKGDRVLHLLHKMSQMSDEHHKYQGQIAAKVNKEALAAYTGQNDVKSLIKAVAKSQ